MITYDIYNPDRIEAIFDVKETSQLPLILKEVYFILENDFIKDITLTLETDWITFQNIQQEEFFNHKNDNIIDKVALDEGKAVELIMRLRPDDLSLVRIDTSIEFVEKMKIRDFHENVLDENNWFIRKVQQAQENSEEIKAYTFEILDDKYMPK